MIDIKAIRQQCQPSGPDSFVSLLVPGKDLISLCDEMERLRKDAARYQFMRSPIISYRAHTQVMNAVDALCEEQMDAAIDAAMEAKP